MALTGSPSDRRIYNDELLFKTYFGWEAAASYGKLREFCIRTGQVNEKTGRPSHMGPYWAVWRYALEHADDPEAFRLYQKWWYETDPMKQTHTWLDWFIQIQRHSYNKKSICGWDEYQRFCDQHNLDVDPSRHKLSTETNTVLSYDKFAMEKIAKEMVAIPEELDEELRQNQEVS